MSAHETHYWLDKHEFEPDHRIGLGLARTFSGVEMLAANKMRAFAFHHVQTLMEEHDLAAIINPTVRVCYCSSSRASMRRP
eukprot:1193347-Prorocentrum_minimum.AAC.2